MSAQTRMSPRVRWLCVLTWIGVALFLFRDSFRPEMVLFSNDGPLSTLVADYHQRPSAFFGVWEDLHWVGKAKGAAPFNLTWILLSILDPISFAKFYAPFTVVFMGFSVALFLASLRMRPLVCWLGSVAAMLNSDFFSYACWGLGPVVLSIAFFMLALAALNLRFRRFPWAAPLMSGLAMGLGVMEGFDVGAILSLYLALYVVFKSWAERPEKPALGRAVASLALIAGFSAIVATQTLYSLVTTQVQDVSVLESAERTAEQQWDWATQWSLPVTEAPRALVAGLYGYRIDTPNGGAYSGAVGRQPGWEETGRGLIRHSGSGFYAGVFVILGAIWGAYLSFRGKDSGFSTVERRWIWFWIAVTVGSLLLAFGRHFFLYKIFYSLPYASTIRNPVKFLHPMSVGIVLLFAYGIEGWFRRGRFDERAAEDKDKQGLFSWMRTSPGLEAPFLKGLFVGFVVLALTTLISASNYPDRVSDLINLEGFPDQDLANRIARFSLAEMGWSILFYLLTMIVFLAVFAGKFRGRGKRIGIGIAAALLILDLGRANAPWIVHYNYEARYQEDALIAALGEEPHLGRVTVAPFQSREMNYLNQFYLGEWNQYQFPYHNIQTLDMSMEPRPNTDDSLFRAAFNFQDPRQIGRYWRLTNTKYLLGVKDSMADRLNSEMAQSTNAFNVDLTFGIGVDESGENFQTVANSEGPFALLENSEALPRAKLYTDWRVMDSAEAVLGLLPSPEFDPSSEVLVSDSAPEPPSVEGAFAESAVVEWKSYAPKRLQLECQSEVPSLLLLNDKYDPDWRVYVNGEERALVRANFLMRGVYLDAGDNEVEFRYDPPSNPLYVSVFAMILGFGFCGFVLSRDMDTQSVAETETE